MKKLFLLLFFVISSISFSQNISGYGVKVGLTSSKFRWDYTTQSGFSSLSFESDRKPGINIGLFAEFFDFPYFSLSTELNYISKGFQKELIATSSECPCTGNKILWKVSLNYINFSLLAKPKIAIDIFTPYILLGPRVDIEVGKSAENDNPENYKEYLKERLGLKLGFGTEVKLFGVNLLSEFIWNIDFKNIYSNEYVGVKTNSYDIRIGIKL